MPVLNIGGRNVTVDDTFLSLSPDEQNDTVDEIASSLGLGASDDRGQRYDEGGVPIGGVPMTEPETPVAPEQPKFGGAAMNATAGANETIYSILGAPVDLARGGRNLVTAGINAVTGSNIEPLPENAGMGSRGIAETLGAIRPELDPQNTEAKSGADRAWRAAGQGAAGAIVPAAGVGALTQAGVKVSPLIQAMAGRSNSLRNAAADAFVGSAAGASSSAAQEVTSDKYDPLSGFAGGVVGGGLGAVATGIPGLARMGADAVSDFLAPVTVKGQERLAATRLREAAQDPQAAREAIENAGAPRVPGSNPTTFQQTGDMGLGALERDVRTQFPAEFQQRAAEQNTARLSAIGDIQPGGAPEQVSRLLRQQVDEIDAEFARGLSDAQEWEKGARRSLGAGQEAEVAGNTMRSKLQANRDAAKDRERALWEAVDPDGTLALPADNARAYIRDRLSQIPASAKPPTGEEAAIHDILRQYGDVSSFREVQALQSRLKTAMRIERENGETPAYGRMSELNSALFRDLESAAVRKVEEQAQAVARGEMRAEDTFAAWLQRDAESWVAERAGQAASGNGGARSIGATRGAAPAVPGVRGAAGQSTGRSGGPASNPRLSGEGLSPNFDEPALGRLNTARDATNDRLSTFDNATLQPMLRRPATNADYRMRDSSVPKNLFTSGAGSFEKIQTFRKAVGDDRPAMEALEGYAIDSLRRAAIDRDTGAVDAGRLESWRRAHTDALRAMPELENRVRNVGDAAQAVEAQVKAKKSALDEAQRGAFGRLIGSDNPEDVRNIVGGLFSRQDSVRQLRALRQRVGKDDEALQGLRKAVADHVTQRLVSNTEAATSGQALLKSDQFQTFVRTNRNALRTIFSEKEVGVLEAVAADLQMGNRSNASVKLPNQSNTAQDQRSILQNVMSAGMENWTTIAGGATGAVVGGAAGPATAAVGAGVGSGMAALFNALRQNGIASVDELVRDAMLNPERARFLLTRVPTKPEQAESMFRALARRYVKAATVGVTVEPKDEPKRGPMPLPPWMTPEATATPLQRALANREGMR